MSHWPCVPWYSVESSNSPQAQGLIWQRWALMPHTAIVYTPLQWSMCLCGEVGSILSCKTTGSGLNLGLGSWCAVHPAIQPLLLDCVINVCLGKRGEGKTLETTCHTGPKSWGNEFLPTFGSRAGILETSNCNICSQLYYSMFCRLWQAHLPLH